MNKSYEDEPEETGVEAEEMETIEREEAAAEVERQDGREPAQEAQESTDLIQFDESPQMQPGNEEMEASAPE